MSGLAREGERWIAALRDLAALGAGLRYAPQEEDGAQGEGDHREQAQGQESQGPKAMEDGLLSQLGHMTHEKSAEGSLSVCKRRDLGKRSAPVRTKASVAGRYAAHYRCVLVKPATGARGQGRRDGDGARGRAAGSGQGGGW